jgi:hypothetical protein
MALLDQRHIVGTTRTQVIGRRNARDSRSADHNLL